MMDDRPAPPRPEGYDTSGATPLYFRIFMVLEREIRAGQYPSAEPMPSEDAIAQRFGVSRVTVRHAMSLLVERGLVTRQRGKGTFASEQAPVAASTGNFSGLTDNIAEFEQGSRVTVLEVAQAQVPGWAVPLAGQWPEPGGQITRMRSDATGPLSYSVCHLAPQAMPWIDVRQIGNRTILGALEEAGMLAARVEQRLGAACAEGAMADHLGLVAGAPLIRMRRVVFDDWGQAFQCLELFYRADRFEYCVNLAREGQVFGAPRWVRA